MESVNVFGNRMWGQYATREDYVQREQELFIGAVNQTVPFLDVINQQATNNSGKLSMEIVLSFVLCGKARILYSKTENASTPNQAVLPDSIKRLLYFDRYIFTVEAFDDEHQELVAAINYLIAPMPFSSIDVERFSNIIAIGTGYAARHLPNSVHSHDRANHYRTFYDKFFDGVFELANLLKMNVLSTKAYNHHSVAIRIPDGIKLAWRQVEQELPLIKVALDTGYVDFDEKVVSQVTKFFAHQEVFYTPYEHISTNDLNVKLEIYGSFSGVLGFRLAQFLLVSKLELQNRMPQLLHNPPTNLPEIQHLFNDICDIAISMPEDVNDRLTYSVSMINTLF